jgi:hypothetical protein
VARNLDPTGGVDYGVTTRPMGHLRRQIAEIHADPVLRRYGAAMAALHVLTVLYWIDQRAIGLLHSRAEPICWPLLPECGHLRVLDPAALSWVLLAYLLAAVAVGALFLSPRQTPSAYWGLLALNALKAGIMLLDFRLRMNQHYMAFAASAAFLFMPGKRNAIRVLVVLFYVWAGTLKLNWEWISGAGLYRPIWFFSGWGVVAACLYVIVLELVVSWGLLARRAAIFWAAFGQVILFHVFSWPVVGFFYPLLMFAILTIFPMCRLMPERRAAAAAEDGLLAAFWRGRERWPTYATAASFSLLQLTPYAFPGDHALTGEGRLYALHMFDARPVCEGYASLRQADGTQVRVDLRLRLDTRIACDPVVFYNRARNLCRRPETAPVSFRDLDLFLWARRATDRDLRPLIALEGFCARNVGYNPFWHNRWILTE